MLIPIAFALCVLVVPVGAVMAFIGSESYRHGSFVLPGCVLMIAGVVGVIVTLFTGAWVLLSKLVGG